MDDIEAQNHTMTIVLDLYNEHSAPQLNQVPFPINVYFMSKRNEPSVLYILSIQIFLYFFKRSWKMWQDVHRGHKCKHK